MSRSPVRSKFLESTYPLSMVPAANPGFSVEGAPTLVCVGGCQHMVLLIFLKRPHEIRKILVRRRRGRSSREPLVPSMDTLV